MAKSPGRRAATPLEIHFGNHGDGCTYELAFWSEDRVRETFPESVRIPRVFLGYPREVDWMKTHAPFWPEVGRMLTGLTTDQILQLGGLRLVHPVENKVYWEWSPRVKKEAG